MSSPPLTSSLLTCAKPVMASKPVHVQHACNPRDEPEQSSQCRLEMCGPRARSGRVEPHTLQLRKRPHTGESLWDTKSSLSSSFSLQIHSEPDGCLLPATVMLMQGRIRRLGSYPATSSTVGNMALSPDKRNRPTSCVEEDLAHITEE